MDFVGEVGHFRWKDIGSMGKEIRGGLEQFDGSWPADLECNTRGK